MRNLNVYVKKEFILSMKNEIEFALKYKVVNPQKIRDFSEIPFE